MMYDIERVIQTLEKCKQYDCDDCTEEHASHYPWDCIAYDEFVSEALNILKEQDKETKIGKWIYCEDESGQDGFRCSECGFFEPWYYDFSDMDFIKNYEFCPSCGRTVTMA